MDENNVNVNINGEMIKPNPVKSRKKIYIISGAVLIIVLILVGFYFIIPILLQETCNPYSDLSNSIKNNDLGVCDCIKDPVQKSLCQGNLSDSALFTKAINQSNSALCEKVSDTKMKEACLNIVTGKPNLINQ